ncbi:phage tail tape measure protein [Pseudomonas sp.]|uniref:phage tail tape measure protein n=1 Tax=Pseudomonas sp. TaxID=306 RepID=UPI003D12BF77
MTDLKTSIVLDLAGNIDRQARRFAGSLGRLGSQGSRHMGALSRSVGAVGRGLDRLGNRYTALITGAAGIGTGRYLLGLEERFTMLGIQADQSADKINGLKQEIFDIARSPEIRVDPGEITTAIEQIVEMTGDLEFAQNQLRNIGRTISATGGRTGAAIGQISAELQKMGLTTEQDVAQALDILTVQGKAGAFTLQNLAQLGSRVVTAYTAMGRTGVPAIREMGAALQIIRQGTGSSEMAATAFEALLRTLADADKVKLLQQGGIQIFDPEAAKEGREVMRSLPVLMEEIIRKTGGRKTLLSQVFDAEAVRAFNAAAGEFQRTGRFDSLQKFMDVQADGTAILHDSARAAATGSRALGNLYTAWKEFADGQLSGPIQSLADALNSLEPGTVDRWLKIGGGVAAVVGTAIAGRKVYQGARWMRGLFRKGGGAAGAAGGLAGGGFGNAVPVYVVNGPSSIWPGTGGTAGKPGVPKVPMGAGAGLLAGGTALLPAAGAAAVAGASIAIGEALARREARMTSTEQLKEIRSRHMVMGGGPDSFQVRTIDAELSRRLAEGMQGNLSIEIDAQGQPRVREMRGRNLDLDVDSGRMMASH